MRTTYPIGYVPFFINDNNSILLLRYSPQKQSSETVKLSKWD